MLGRGSSVPESLALNFSNTSRRIDLMLPCARDSLRAVMFMVTGRQVLLPTVKLACGMCFFVARKGRLQLYHLPGLTFQRETESPTCRCPLLLMLSKNDTILARFGAHDGLASSRG